MEIKEIREVAKHVTKFSIIIFFSLFQEQTGKLMLTSGNRSKTEIIMNWILMLQSVIVAVVFLGY
jgi:hypothetical protein